MNTPNLTFQAPQSDIIATVKSAKDPDIAVGAKVRVTGYVGIVTAITRRNTMGLSTVQEDVAHSFDLGELEFEDRAQIHHPEPTSAIETKMPCCGYSTERGKPTPIYWNPYNRVVQCHNCGQQFEPHTFIEKIVSKNRNRLPDTRYALTHKFDVGGQKGYVTVGFYDLIEDPESTMDLSRPGEVFVVVQRQGSTLQGFADAWARSVSMLLQYGVPVSEVCRMFAYHKFEPRGITPNPDIRMANSIVDYVARWLGHTCIAGYQPGGEPVAEVPDSHE